MKLGLKRQVTCSFKARFDGKEGYTPNDLLTSQQIKMYVAKKALVKLDGNSKKTRNNTLTSVKIDDKSGIGNSGFDSTIDKMNGIQESIIWQ